MVILKRDRHITHHATINDLQRKSEEALNDMDRLERSRTQEAQIAAFTIGLTGTAILAD